MLALTIMSFLITFAFLVFAVTTTEEIPKFLWLIFLAGYVSNQLSDIFRLMGK